MSGAAKGTKNCWTCTHEDSKTESCNTSNTVAVEPWQDSTDFTPVRRRGIPGFIYMPPKRTPPCPAWEGKKEKR